MPEKPSVWNDKPWWCQPWSIVLTGMAIITTSWLLLKIWWVTTLVALPVLVWMVYFLIIYPRLMQDILAQADRSAE